MKLSNTEKKKHNIFFYNPRLNFIEKIRPEEGRGVQLPKRLQYDNKDEDSSVNRRGISTSVGGIGSLSHNSIGCRPVEATVSDDCFGQTRNTMWKQTSLIYRTESVS